MSCRHLVYNWRLGPDTAMFQLPFTYDGNFLRGPEAYNAVDGQGVPPPVPESPIPNGSKITGALTGWDYSAWPEPGIPFSIFTSQYGSGAKTPRGIFNNIPDGLTNRSPDRYTPPAAFENFGRWFYDQGSDIPFDNWKRKQVAFQPLVQADQFLVFNNFGSTPGVLPNPKTQKSHAFDSMVINLKVNGQQLSGYRIESIDYCERNLPAGTGPEDIPEEAWTPIQIPFGYPLSKISSNPLGLRNGTIEEFEDGHFRGFLFTDDDPRSTTLGPGANWSSFIANAIIYPANSKSNVEEFAQINPDGTRQEDNIGYVGLPDYDEGIVGLFPRPVGGDGIPDTYVADPDDVAAGDIGEFGPQEYSGGFINQDAGKVEIQWVLSLARNRPTQAPPQMRIRYFPSFGKLGGSALVTTYAQTFSGIGKHGPITPPNRYDNNWTTAADQGPRYFVEYVNNNEVDFVSWETPNGFVNLVVNDSRYYENPDGTASPGISGDAAPFPVQPGIGVPQYTLKPNVYVLPGQTFDVEYTVFTDMQAFPYYLQRVGQRVFGGNPANIRTRPNTLYDFARVFVDYWLFDGADAMICHKLLKLGIDVSPESVDWYKRMILNMEGLQPDTYEKYLILLKEWRKRQEIRDKAYHRKRGIRARNR